MGSITSENENEIYTDFDRNFHNTNELLLLLFQSNNDSNFNDELKDIDIYHKKPTSSDQSNVPNFSDNVQILIPLSNEKKNKKIFSIEKVLKKKRGRKRIKNNFKNIHNYLSKDNIKSKYQTACLKFCLKFIQIIYKKICGETRKFFLPLSHKSTSSVSSEFINQLKSLTLSDLLSKFPVSPKYSRHSRNHNKQIYEDICKNYPEMRIFLDNTLYSKLIKEVFNKDYPNQEERKVDMNEFGLNFEVILPKDLKTKQDVLKKNIYSKNYEEFKDKFQIHMTDYFYGQFRTSIRRRQKKQKRSQDN